MTWMTKDSRVKESRGNRRPFFSGLEASASPGPLLPFGAAKVLAI